MIALPLFNLFLFFVEAVFYFTVMLALLHFRRRLGLGVFLAALGVMHFLETYLAAVIYVELPFGTVSPGSSILFAGKLMLILLLYIKEDAETVRQPIYGLFLGNLTTVAIGLLLQFHVVDGAGPVQDTAFIEKIGWLMLWGTTLLYVDSIGIILLYERLGRFMPRRVVPRLLVSGIVLLTFDQIAFFGVLHTFYDVPLSAFWSGWIGKMVAVFTYAAIYLLYSRMHRTGKPYATARPLADIFGDLTFRERYEDLLARSGRDTLTGVFDRARLEIDAPTMIREDLQSGEPISTVILDVDHFKSINDRFGHLQGDEVLKALADLLQTAIREEDRLYRFGGEEFVVILPRLDHRRAMALAERLRHLVELKLAKPDLDSVTISCGVASGPEDGLSFAELISIADKRLYAAKGRGRNCVSGQPDEAATGD